MNINAVQVTVEPYLVFQDGELPKTHLQIKVNVDGKIQDWNQIYLTDDFVSRFDQLVDIAKEVIKNHVKEQL